MSPKDIIIILCIISIIMLIIACYKQEKEIGKLRAEAIDLANRLIEANEQIIRASKTIVNKNYLINLHLETIKKLSQKNIDCVKDNLDYKKQVLSLKEESDKLLKEIADMKAILNKEDNDG